MHSSMNEQLLEAIQTSSEVERLFFGVLLKTGGDHPCIDPSELECREMKSVEKLCGSPLVSVSVITYNHENYLRQTLDSLLAQETDFEYEILIGEDCSTDHTRDIAFEYQKHHPDKIRVLYSDRNVGLTANSQRNLLKARGKYYALCEGDDFWCNPQKLQLQVDFLERHPDFGLVHGNANKVDVNSELLADAIQTPRYGDSGFEQNNVARELLSGARCIITCTTMLRRHILEELCTSYPLLFSTKMRLGDVQTWLGIASRSRVHYFPEILATYRHSATSITSRGNPVGRLQFMSDVFIVDTLCVNYFLSGDNTVKRILYCRLIGAIILLSYTNRKFVLLSTSLAMENFLGCGAMPIWLARWMLYLRIPKSCFAFIYRFNRKVANCWNRLQVLTSVLCLV